MNIVMRALRLWQGTKPLPPSQLSPRHLVTASREYGQSKASALAKWYDQTKRHDPAHRFPPRRDPTRHAAPKTLSVKRFIPEEAKKFFSADGRLTTTEANEAFLLTNDLEPDNGVMVKLAGKELGKMASRFSTTIGFSPRHVIGPYDLKYFDPRGHPLAAAVRKRYEDRLASPLWVMTTVIGGASAVVRATAARMLKRSVSESLEKIGYDEAVGKGGGREICGTIWLTIHDPTAVASLDVESFGRSLAEFLDRQYGRSVA